VAFLVGAGSGLVIYFDDLLALKSISDVVFYFAGYLRCAIFGPFLVILMKFLRPLLTILVLWPALFLLFIRCLFYLLCQRLLPYRVAHMIDADSLLVYDGKALKKVQLIGVDAPELTGPQKGHQCYDKQALAEASRVLRERSRNLAGRRYLPAVIRISTDATCAM
jgi:hypothetical protein